jgi:hypothetical protein
MTMPGIASVIISIVNIVFVVIAVTREPSQAVVTEVPVLTAVLGLQIAVESSVSNPVFPIVDSVVLMIAPVLALQGAVELTVVVPVAEISPIIVFS